MKVELIWMIYWCRLTWAITLPSGTWWARDFETSCHCRRGTQWDTAGKLARLCSGTKLRFPVWRGPTVILESTGTLRSSTALIPSALWEFSTARTYRRSCSTLWVICTRRRDAVAYLDRERAGQNGTVADKRDENFRLVLCGVSRIISENFTRISERVVSLKNFFF